MKRSSSPGGAGAAFWGPSFDRNDVTGVSRTISAPSSGRGGRAVHSSSTHLPGYNSVSSPVFSLGSAQTRAAAVAVGDEGGGGQSAAPTQRLVGTRARTGKRPGSDLTRHEHDGGLSRPYAASARSSGAVPAAAASSGVHGAPTSLTHGVAAPGGASYGVVRLDSLGNLARREPGRGGGRRRSNASVGVRVDVGAGTAAALGGEGGTEEVDSDLDPLDIMNHGEFASRSDWDSVLATVSQGAGAGTAAGAEGLRRAASPNSSHG